MASSTSTGAGRSIAHGVVVGRGKLDSNSPSRYLGIGYSTDIRHVVLRVISSVELIRFPIGD